MTATGACASGIAPLSQGKGDLASRADPPVTGARALSTDPPSYGIIQATGASASDAAPLSLGKGAHAPSVALPRHALRDGKTDAPYVIPVSEGT